MNWGGFEVNKAGNSESLGLVGPKPISAADGHLFLTPEWIREVLRLVQAARRNNESFRLLTRGFTLNVAYVVQSLPEQLRAFYGGADQAVVFVQLEKGAVRRFEIGAHLPSQAVDFTISSDYRIAKRIFQGELTPGSSFINRLVHVEPLEKLSRRPKFAARAIVVGNLILKFARRAQTVYLPGW